MRLGICISAAALVLTTASAALASTESYGMAGVGGKLGYLSPETHDGTMMVGGHLDFQRSDTRVHLEPNLMFWRVDRVSDVNPNFDVTYHFSPDGQVTPYLGGGLGLNMRTNDSALGANFIGGLRFPGESNHYFVEGRYTASNIDQVSLVGGITFNAH